MKSSEWDGEWVAAARDQALARGVFSRMVVRDWERSLGLQQLWKVALGTGAAVAFLVVVTAIMGTLGRAGVMLGFALATLLTMVATVPVADALRTGIFSFGGQATDRAKAPRLYWNNVASFCAVGVAMLILAIWSGALLIELVVGPR